MDDLPTELQAAIESGTLTTDQVRQLADLEAQALGLTLDQALEKARRRELPQSYLGQDLQMLCRAFLGAE